MDITNPALGKIHDVPFKVNFLLLLWHIIGFCILLSKISLFWSHTACAESQPSTILVVWLLPSDLTYGGSYSKYIISSYFTGLSFNNQYSPLISREEVYSKPQSIFFWHDSSHFRVYQPQCLQRHILIFNVFCLILITHFNI